MATTFLPSISSPTITIVSLIPALGLQELVFPPCPTPPSLWIPFFRRQSFNRFIGRLNRSSFFLFRCLCGLLPHLGRCHDAVSQAYQCRRSQYDKKRYFFIGHKSVPEMHIHG